MAPSAAPSTFATSAADATFSATAAAASALASSPFQALQDLVRLFEYIPDIHFWIKDAEGRFRAANPAFVRHFGLKSFRNMEGKTDFDLHPHPFAQEYSQDDRSVLLAKKVIANKMELVSELDGSLKWYSTTKVPLKDAQGRYWATAGFTRPVSDFTGEAAPVDGLTKVVDHIQKRFDGDLDIPALARMAGLSEVQFERNFRKVMKETPSKYINKTRMRAACQMLLRSDLSVAEVARKSGFSDPGYFAKRFFLYLKISPTDYRLKYRNRPAT